MAIRTQQILMWESGVRNVADPLAGSYYVEKLTDDIEAAAWELYNEIEANGGYQKGLETGEIKAITEACVAQLEARAKAGDGAAPGALQALYRALANVEI